MADKTQWMYRSSSDPNVSGVELSPRDHRFRLTNVNCGYLVWPTPQNLAFANNFSYPAPDVTFPGKDPKKERIYYEESLMMRMSRTGPGAEADHPNGPISISTYEQGRSIGHVFGGGDLVIVKSKRLEWRVTGKSKQAALKVGDLFGIYNTKRQDWIVYRPNGWGAEGRSPGLQWFKFTEPNNSTIYLQPQTGGVGAVLYRARWPLIGSPAYPESYIDSFSVPIQHSGRMVVSFKCVGSDQLCDVEQGTTVSAAQMQSIFGTQRPLLPVELSAFVATDPPKSIGPIALNIVWYG